MPSLTRCRLSNESTVRQLYSAAPTRPIALPPVEQDYRELVAVIRRRSEKSPDTRMTIHFMENGSG